MDIDVTDHGSIVMVRVVTDAGRAWVAENVPLESWQWMGDAFACEPRCLENLVAGMRDDSLIVGGDCE